MAGFLSEGDVTLTEENEFTEMLGDDMVSESEFVVTDSVWTAKLKGRLAASNGSEMPPYRSPIVELERKGSTAAQAMKNLREAVEAQGWVLR